MKRGILLAFLSFSVICANQFQNETSSYDKIFEKIKEKRSGLNAIELTSVKDPFKQESLKPKVDQNRSNEYQSSRGLSLKAILLNKANINSKWYSVGDIVDEYKLTSVTRNSVVLIKGDEKQELTLKNGSRNVGIKIK